MSAKKFVLKDDSMKNLENKFEIFFKDRPELCAKCSNISNKISNDLLKAKNNNEVSFDEYDNAQNFLTCLLRTTCNVENCKENIHYGTLKQEDVQILNDIIEYLFEMEDCHTIFACLWLYRILGNVECLLSKANTIDLKKPNSLAEFLKYINDLGIQNLYFRGQENKDWLPEAGIFRDKYKMEIRGDREKEFYDALLMRCPEEFSGLGHLDRLVKMQHYGLPTRLLDITSNPLMALYFACQSCLQSDEDVYDKDGVVFIFKPHDVKSAESDVGMMIATLACFSKDDQNAIAASSFSCDSSGVYKDENVEKFFYELSKERPAFKRTINPEDLHKNCFIQPNYLNKRLKCQSGAFVMIGLDNEPLFRGSTDGNLTIPYKIIIPKEFKKYLLSELDNIAINRATVYQDLENASKYIREKKKS